MCVYVCMEWYIYIYVLTFVYMLKCDQKNTSWWNSLVTPIWQMGIAKKNTVAMDLFFGAIQALTLGKRLVHRLGAYGQTSDFAIAQLHPQPLHGTILQPTRSWFSIFKPPKIGPVPAGFEWRPASVSSFRSPFASRPRNCRGPRSAKSAMPPAWRARQSSGQRIIRQRTLGKGWKMGGYHGEFNCNYLWLVVVFVCSVISG